MSEIEKMRRRYSTKAEIIDLLNKASVRELELILRFVRSFLR